MDVLSVCMNVLMLYCDILVAPSHSLIFHFLVISSVILIINSDLTDVQVTASSFLTAVQ